MKASKKNESAWANDYVERIQVEFVTKQFNMMMSQYPSLEQMSSMLPVGKFLKANDMLLDGNIPPARPIAAINQSLLEKQLMTQKQMSDLSNTINENFSSEVESVINQPHVCINLRYREQLGPDDTHLSHTIINYTPIFGSSDCFNSPEDDIVDVVITAGDANGIKQAIMHFQSDDGYKYYTELADFCVLSLLEKNDEKEKAVFTAFNRQLGILYSAYIEGLPNLKNAALPLLSSPANETSDIVPSVPAANSDNIVEVKS